MISSNVLLCLTTQQGHLVSNDIKLGEKNPETLQIAIFISARRKPGGDHVFGPVLVCLYPSAANLAYWPISLVFVCAHL